MSVITLAILTPWALLAGKSQRPHFVDKKTEQRICDYQRFENEQINIMMILFAIARKIDNNDISDTELIEEIASKQEAFNNVGQRVTLKICEEGNFWTPNCKREKELQLRKDLETLQEQ